MKSQNEPGFAMVPNKLLDAIITCHFAEMKMEILMFIIRHTFGYHRESVTTTAVHIASHICRNKIKTTVTLRELIQSNVIKEVIGEKGSRSFSINMNTMEWRPRPLPELLEMTDENPNGENPGTQETVSHMGKRETSQKETPISQSGNRDISQKENSLSGKGKSEVSLHDIQSCNPGNFEPNREVSSESAQMDTLSSDLGAIKESHPVSFESAQMGYPQKPAYIDKKNENSCPKENIKENNKRNIYMYDFTLIPPAMQGRPGFKKAFNNWCIYRQEIQKPLTHLAIEPDIRKILMLSC